MNDSRDNMNNPNNDSQVHPDHPDQQQMNVSYDYPYGDQEKNQNHHFNYHHQQVLQNYINPVPQENPNIQYPDQVHHPTHNHHQHPSPRPPLYPSYNYSSQPQSNTHLNYVSNHQSQYDGPSLSNVQLNSYYASSNSSARVMGNLTRAPNQNQLPNFQNLSKYMIKFLLRYSNYIFINFNFKEFNHKD